MGKRPKVILLIETSREYGRGLLRGIAKYSHLHGPWVFYREPAGLDRAIPRLKSWGPDGMIIRETKKIGPKQVRSMAVPTIVCPDFKGPIRGLPTLIADNLAIGKMAAEYLLCRGFRHFAYCSYSNVYWSRMRGRGFTERIANDNLKVSHYRKQRPADVRLSWQKEQTLMAGWLKSLPKPVAVMACNDDRGAQVSEACKIAELPVPEQVAILCVDNDEFVCGLADPPLSSIALNTETAGYKAAALLDRLMTGKKTAHRNILVRPLQIVTRRSTDIMAIEDLEVAHAVRFIRENSRQPIQVDEVARTVALSRRNLEQRFRSVLRYPVSQEIRRARLEHITKMLLATNLTVSQIASALGYSGAQNMSRYFRQAKGMNPLAFRKMHIHE